MPDLASKQAGGKVFLVSSLDPAHPGENVIDGDDTTFWISTGLYPQEILLDLGQLARVSSVSLSSTRVRNLRVEGWSHEDTRACCKTLAEGEIENTASGWLQKRQLTCSKQEIDYVLLVILSGWDDFCTIHNIQVDGERVAPRRESTRSAQGMSSGGRAASKRPSEYHTNLEVSIPEHPIKEKNEPDAPRKPDNTRTWGPDGQLIEVRPEGSS